MSDKRQRAFRWWVDSKDGDWFILEEKEKYFPNGVNVRGKWETLRISISRKEIETLYAATRPMARETDANATKAEGK